MRISYWSSDVCSSDLSVLQYLTGLPLPGRRLSPKSSCASILQMLAKETAASVPASVPKVALQRCVHADAALPDGCTDLQWRAGDNRLSHTPRHGDRKSVVEGRSA